LEECNQVWQHCLSHQVKKKNDEDDNQFVDDEPIINERKQSSTTVSKGALNNGEHTLITVTAKMIHSAFWKCKKFILKDIQPLHMVKFVGAVRNFRGNTKYAQIDVEDGMGLVRVILLREEKECMVQSWLIHKCNSSLFYLCNKGS
jgi:hypothetical protein